MDGDALFMGRYPARTRAREGLRAVLAERQLGKTTRLIEWLVDGEPIEEWPSWSRVLIVTRVDRLMETRDRFRAADQALRDKGCPGGLGKVILTLGDYSIQRLRLADVEVAVDNAEDLIAQAVGFMPDLISMTASAVQQR